VTRQLELIVPPVSIRFYEAGLDCEDPKDGDFLIVDHGTLVDEFIGAGQRLEAKFDSALEGFTWARHVAYYRDGQVSEMGFRGWERRDFETYRKRLYAIARFDVSAERIATANSYDLACKDVEYALLDYAPLVVDGLTHQEFVLTLNDDLICSAHATLVAMGLGLFPDRPASIVIPARFALWVNAAHA
jgi:hypothetical protein